MTKLQRIGVLSLVAIAFLAVSMAGTTWGQVKKGKSRPLQTKNLMKGIVASHSGALKKALDAKPADEKAWKTVIMHAEILNESSYTLMDDGRCPDGDWAGAATTLREGSADVLAKAEANDLDGANAAFGALRKSCGECHKVHKK